MLATATAIAPNNKDQLLSDWKAAAAALASAKAAESELRKQVVEAFSNDAAPGHSGTENIDLGWGYKLKVVHKLNYKLDTADNASATLKALEIIERGMEGGNIVAERLVKWKPELSLTEYKLLTPANKMVIDRVLTITDGSPEVTLVPPKKGA